MTPDEILETARAYQPACLLAAAADLDIFPLLCRQGPLSTPDVAKALGADPRGAAILLDALVAVRLLRKEGALYVVPEDVARSLGGAGPCSLLAMAQHQANCMRRWADLAKVVLTGKPAARTPSVRGDKADREAFIEAMDNLSGPVADRVVAALRSVEARSVLDVGGASGSWTIAFLRMWPAARATLFDLPEVIPLAERRLSDAGVRSRVTLKAGDFLEDPLPPGADLAWVSAIAHQNSRAQNRLLFSRVRDALLPGGRIAVRDIVMEPSRTEPVAGALFAVNMLVGTEGGGTFTLEDLREDLLASGFGEAELVRRDPGMHSIVVARRPEV
jgi:precorrin-6B methylase 2